ncbi:MAG: MMPL family transporter [Deltaproteobacteria bacterium]|nr:MMPL family transporter [Deltaproteobacteria bacterium]
MFAATRFFINHPRLVILLCVATVISASIFALRVERDNSLGNMIPDDNPVIVYYNDEFSKYFDLRSKVVVGLFSDESIYRPDTLAKLERVTRALEKDSRLVNVTSLATAEDITVDDGLMNIEPIMADVPGTGAEAEALRARVNDNVFIRDGLVSDDERATLIVAMPVFEVSETEKSIQLYDDVLALLESEQGPERLVFSGFPVAVGLINKYMTRDIKVMLPIVALVMILTLYASFRTIRGVLIPMAVVGFSVVCTFRVHGRHRRENDDHRHVDSRRPHRRRRGGRHSRAFRILLATPARLVQARSGRTDHEGNEHAGDSHLRHNLRRLHGPRRFRDHSHPRIRPSRGLRRRRGDGFLAGLYSRDPHAPARTAQTRSSS